jgi:hypothetical protein
MMENEMKGRNDMANPEQYRAAEQELIGNGSSILRAGGGHGATGHCPSPRDLRCFADGKFEGSEAQRDELLAHLALCDRCIDSLARLRQHRTVRRMAFAFASAIVVITAAAWLWVNQHRASPDSNQVATVDLRLISTTRGQAPGPQTATVRKAAGGLRIVLPVGSEGNYQVAILGQDRKPTPLPRISGNTRLEGHDLVLNLPVNLSNLNSGEYLLALRRDGGEWEYYSVILE